MILLSAVILGLFAGLLNSWWHHKRWQPPVFKWASMVLVAFLPQLAAFYVPGLRDQFSDQFAAVCLMTSQVGLLIFCWTNREQPFMPLLIAGLLLNLFAITANGGLMPISTTAATHIIPADLLQTLQLGSRFSTSSKDVLLDPQSINFPWLADRFLSPAWLPYHFVFSIGDVLISLGAFFLLALQSTPAEDLTQKETLHVNQPIE